MARCLLQSNQVSAALRFARVAKTIHARGLDAVRQLAEARRFGWRPELARSVRDRGLPVEVVVEGRGRQVIALSAATIVCGNALPHAGRFRWDVHVDNCIRGVIRIGICTAELPSGSGYAWGLYPHAGPNHLPVLQRFAWDKYGPLNADRLDYDAATHMDGCPNGHNSKLGAFGQLSRLTHAESHPTFVLSCIFDVDAGTLEYVYRSATPPHETVADVALTGFGRGMRMRPWIYLSNPGDAVTVTSGPCLIVESQGGSV